MVVLLIVLLCFVGWICVPVSSDNTSFLFYNYLVLLLLIFPAVIKVEFSAVFTSFALQSAIYQFCLYVAVVRGSFQQKLLKVTVASVVLKKICTFLKSC